ncbi:MAG TPA: DUF192 domain-containing protein [Candidatus Binatia bacterium]|nr:DUF192 domain-containing protein [Candidatus Binatia bacterium]
MKHALNAVVCRSSWSKARGLMFSRRKNLVFAFEQDTSVPLHMLFVFFPIDVFYLDAKKNVIEAKKGFKPFTFYTPKNKARYVVEVPSPSDIKVGDRIEISGDAGI